MVVGFPTIYAISAYHYLSCEFDYEVYFRNASYSLMYISKSFSPQIKIYDALELIWNICFDITGHCYQCLLSKTHFGWLKLTNCSRKRGN
jgi:hypothetical protein